jgi:hypothetical protein
MAYLFMKKVERLTLYHDLFSLIAQYLRIAPKKLAERMNEIHKPRNAYTYTKHLQNMYEKEISYPPWIILKPYLGYESMAFFCRKENKKGLYNTFKNLNNDTRVSYVTLLSDCDFLFISRDKSIERDLKNYNLELMNFSCMYTPVYTNPQGWNCSMQETLDSLVNFQFNKGLIKREVYRDLGWNDLDWEIYQIMRLNVRKKFTKVSRETNAAYSTVKRHFYNEILPKCIVANIFFPKGYRNYQLLILRIKSYCEKSLIESFQGLSCTNIFFSLENDLILYWYHQNTQEILKALQKIEEIGAIEAYHLYNPVIYGSFD